MSTGSSVKVSIFGNEYRVSGEGQEEYIQRLADYVDHTMREISQQGRHVTTERIAILAAFNIADQLFQHKGGEALPEEGASEEKAERLLKLFDALDD
jgi:cell division protein ZapA